MLLFSGVYVHSRLHFWIFRKVLRERLTSEPWTKGWSLPWKRQLYLQKLPVSWVCAREGGCAESSWKDPTASPCVGVWAGSEKLGPAWESTLWGPQAGARGRGVQRDHASGPADKSPQWNICQAIAALWQQTTEAAEGKGDDERVKSAEWRRGQELWTG